MLWLSNRLKPARSIDIYQLPVPRLGEDDPRFRAVMERAARLTCTTPAFDALAEAVGLSGHEDGATEAGKRAQLRAELDAHVAHLYDLSEEEYRHVLATFPLVEDTQKEATLAAYRALAPDPDDEALAQLIEDAKQHGESRFLEFKVGAYCNPHTGQKDGHMIKKVLEAVAAFLNSRDGGAVVLGVADDPVEVVGVEDDLAITGLDTEDAFRQTLSNAISSRLDGLTTGFYDVGFHAVDGRRLCCIAVEAAPEPVYLNDELIVRDAAGKRTLKAKDVAAYLRVRFDN